MISDLWCIVFKQWKYTRRTHAGVTSFCTKNGINIELDLLLCFGDFKLPKFRVQISNH